MINSINIQIRETNTDDFDSIMTVEKQAFGYDKEAQLVADLLADKTAKPMVSLLAFYKGEAVGHILFTRAYFDGQGAQQMMHILCTFSCQAGISTAGYRRNADTGRYREVAGKRFVPCVCIGA